MQAIGRNYQYYNNYYSYPQSNNISFKSAPQEDDSSKQFAINAGGLAVASVLLHKVSEFLAKKLLNGEEFTSAENIHKVANSMLEENKLKDIVQVEYIDHKNKFQFGKEMAQNLEAVARGENAFYTEKEFANGNIAKLAVAPKSKPSLILHELGHAINASKGPFMRFLQKSRNPAIAIPAVLATLSGLLPKNQDNEPNFIQRNAGLIGFAGFLPTIIEEGIASLRGISAAKKVLGNVNLSALKHNYAFALGTYILSGIGLGIAAKQSVME